MMREQLIRPIVRFITRLDAPRELGMPPQLTRWRVEFNAAGQLDISLAFYADAGHDVLRESYGVTVPDPQLRTWFIVGSVGNDSPAMWADLVSVLDGRQPRGEPAVTGTAARNWAEMVNLRLSGRGNIDLAYLTAELYAQAINDVGNGKLAV